MTNYRVLAQVRDFFATAGYVGLILPNGWFGRPYDNLLHLTRSDASEDSLVLELDDQLVLTFTGEPEVMRTDGGMRLTGFMSLTWDWTEFGSTASHHEEFASGVVEFVAKMG